MNKWQPKAATSLEIKVLSQQELLLLLGANMFVKPECPITVCPIYSNIPQCYTSGNQTNSYNMCSLYIRFQEVLRRNAEGN